MTPATSTSEDAPRRRPLLRLARRIATYYILGGIAGFGVAVILAGNLDPRPGQTVTAERVDGLKTWTVAATRRPGAAYLLSVRDINPTPAYSLGSWSVEQALGPPNTSGYGDISTAWTTPSQDNTTALEWLELDYPAATVPAAVHVYETYNPGALVRATVYGADGNEIEAWSGADPSLGQTVVCVSTIPLAVDFPVSRVRLYLNTAKVPGWNEIDAVSLVGRDGTVQWASDARASASYGASTGKPPTYRSVTSPSPEQLAPAWTGFHQPTPEFVKGQQIHEERVAAAFGWPFLAVTGSQVAKPPPTPTQTTGQNGGPPLQQPGGTGPQLLSTPLRSDPPDENTNGAGQVDRLSELATDYPERTTLAPPAYFPGGAQPSGIPGGSAYLTGGSGLVALPPPPGTPTVSLAQGTIPRPTGVLWQGLLLNALVFAPIVAILHWLAVVPQRFVRELARLRRGRCIACGYDLNFDFVHGCPDCGWRRGEQFASASSNGAGEDPRIAFSADLPTSRGRLGRVDADAGTGVPSANGDASLDDTGPSSLAARHGVHQ